MPVLSGGMDVLMKRKICVYAICKNEEQFVDRWMDSMREADMVIVADTGSTDSTVEKLRSRGAVVHQIEVKPWRFDVARNLSLSFVPEDADICVCTDLDEVFARPWRKALEDAWTENITRARYSYWWSVKPDGTPGVNFLIEKIHARQGFRWIHPVHEVLEYTGEKPDLYAFPAELELRHYPDDSKPRSQYLPLLELSVAEDPEDDRNMHYLGREYMFYRKWDQCIETLTLHLALPKAVWKDERCASMRYIARSYREKGELQNARSWLYRAIAEAPYLREPYVELATLEYSQENWPAVYHMVEAALTITEQAATYINEPSSWDHTLYDLGALACYWLGMTDKAYQMIERACEKAPDDERLRRNREFIAGKL